VRKSKKLRLEQTEALAAKYNNLGFRTKISIFVNECVFKLSRNKNLTTAQRKWLDNLIEEGQPIPKNKSMYKKITDAASVHGLDPNIKNNLLETFARIAFNGWDMSEKQGLWLEGMLNDADKVRENGKWEPEPGLKSRIIFANNIAKSRNSGYWDHRPGERKAHLAVTAWLLDSNVHISKWHIDKLFKSSRVALRELDNPSYSPGEIKVYCKTYSHKQLALIISGPHAGFVSSKPSYEVLVEGEVLHTQVDKLKKRISFA
jgi:hypothetical protein